MKTGKKRNEHPPAATSKNKFSKNKLAKHSKGFHVGFQKYHYALFAVLLISFIAYLPVFSNDFVNLDDDTYIQNNLLIRTINFKELFSGFVMGNYHPFTMLIYSLEFKIFGLDARGFHAVNLLFHLLNVILVFRAVLLLGDKPGVALIASLLFGIHPLHVESVAWAAELKDLLYVFFFLGSYIYYLRYINTGLRKFYFYCLFLFLFSLLSKAMAVSLPVVLLLTDYFKGRKLNGSIFIEKAPFFVLSVIFGVLAIFAQHSMQAISHDHFTFPQHLVFASYGFITYLVKLFLPLHLCVDYPYPAGGDGSIPAQFYLYPFLFIGLAIAVFYSLRYTRMILFGMGFFTVTVFLVLQLLPVGDAIMADRYSYLPSIGIFYLAGEAVIYLWSIKKFNRNLKRAGMLLFSGALVLYSVKTHSQCGVWKNSERLWDEVIRQDPTVYFAYINRGLYLESENKHEEALSNYKTAIALRPEHAEAYNNRGIVFNDLKKYDEALNDCNKAIALRPDYAEAFYNRGIVMTNMTRYEDAFNDFNRAAELQPGFAEAYYNRGIIYNNFKKYEEALNDFNKAISLKRNFAEVYASRGSLLENENKEYDEALSDYNKAILLKPDLADAYVKRGNVLNKFGRHEEALRDFNKLVDLSPGLASSYSRRGIVLNDLKRYDEALKDFNKAIELQPDYAIAYYCRGVAEYNLGEKENCCADFQQAANLGSEEAKNAYQNNCH